MNKGKFHIITLGCPKNTVDSENMSALLNADGFSSSDTLREADVIVINTCCFIQSAKEESIETILEASKLKEETGAKLLVTGCFPQRYKDELAKELPEVDSWMGLEDLSAVVKVVNDSLLGKKVKKYLGSTPCYFQDLPRIFSTPSNYGYLKIAEGCSHSCSFCVIPGIRGRYRSMPMESVIENAEKLIMSGRREIILIAQDTTIYGVDLYREKKLADLLEKICLLPGLRWLRLMYAFPGSLDDRILKTIAENRKICPYIDIPLQHSHEEVLKKMGRPADPLSIMEKIRRFLPDAAVRTAFIVGHPGETEKRFLHLVDFVREMKFYNLGVFTYSPEEGTESANYKSRPSKREAEKRAQYLMEIQQGISEELRRNMVGKTVPAVCETLIEGEPGEGSFVLDLESEKPDFQQLPLGTTALGRTVYDAPDIDGLLCIKGPAPEPGAYFDARITGCSPYDLIGEWE